jgi:hypothetical protein
VEADECGRLVDQTGITDDQVFGGIGNSLAFSRAFGSCRGQAEYVNVVDHCLYHCMHSRLLSKRSGNKRLGQQRPVPPPPVSALT